MTFMTFSVRQLKTEYNRTVWEINRITKLIGACVSVAQLQFSPRLQSILSPERRIPPSGDAGFSRTLLFRVPRSIHPAITRARFLFLPLFSPLPHGFSFFNTRPARVPSACMYYTYTSRGR